MTSGIKHPDIANAIAKPAVAGRPAPVVARRCAASTAGFTLIEVVIVMFLAALLATLAAPMYRNLSLNQNVRTAATSMQSTMLFARSEAIKRAQNVSIVPNASDWKNGWTVQ